MKISKAEFYVDGSLFTFSLKPYFLSLTFSHELLSESEVNWSVYNPDTFELNCTVEKKNKGDFFENLNMIQALLTTSKPTSNKPLV